MQYVYHLPYNVIVCIIYRFTILIGVISKMTGYYPSVILIVILIFIFISPIVNQHVTCQYILRGITS